MFNWLSNTKTKTVELTPEEKLAQYALENPLPMGGLFSAFGGDIIKDPQYVVVEGNSSVYVKYFSLKDNDFVTVSRGHNLTYWISELDLIEESLVVVVDQVERIKELMKFIADSKLNVTINLSTLKLTVIDGLIRHHQHECINAYSFYRYLLRSRDEHAPVENILSVLEKDFKDLKEFKLKSEKRFTEVEMKYLENGPSIKSAAAEFNHLEVLKPTDLFAKYATLGGYDIKDVVVFSHYLETVEYSTESITYPIDCVVYVPTKGFIKTFSGYFFKD